MTQSKRLKFLAIINLFNPHQIIGLVLFLDFLRPVHGEKIYLPSFIHDTMVSCFAFIGYFVIASIFFSFKKGMKIIPIYSLLGLLLSAYSLIKDRLFSPWIMAKFSLVLMQTYDVILPIAIYVGMFLIYKKSGQIKEQLK